MEDAETELRTELDVQTAEVNRLRAENKMLLVGAAGSVPSHYQLALYTLAAC